MLFFFFFLHNNKWVNVNVRWAFDKQARLYIVFLLSTVQCAPTFLAILAAAPHRSKVPAILTRASENASLAMIQRPRPTGVWRAAWVMQSYRRCQAAWVLQCSGLSCMTHPINGSPAALRRRRTHYTSSLQRQSSSLLSLWLRQGRDPAQSIWRSTGSVSCLRSRTRGRISAAARHSGGKKPTRSENERNVRNVVPLVLIRLSHQPHSVSVVTVHRAGRRDQEGVSSVTTYSNSQKESGNFRFLWTKSS